MTGTAHIAKDGHYTKSYNSSFFGFVEDGKGHNYTIGVLVIEPTAPYTYFASNSAVPIASKIIDVLVGK
jgi:cell division protein FtsI (penicillin-binding protein 3)